MDMMGRENRMGMRLGVFVLLLSLLAPSLIHACGCTMGSDTIPAFGEPQPKTTESFPVSCCAEGSEDAPSAPPSEASETLSACAPLRMDCCCTTTPEKGESAVLPPVLQGLDTIFRHALLTPCLPGPQNPRISWTLAFSYSKHLTPTPPHIASTVLLI